MVRQFEEFFKAKQGETGLMAVMEQRFSENALVQTQQMQVISGLYEALKEAYSYIVRVEEQVLTMRSDITSVVEKTSDILSLTQESREKHYVGKDVELLDKAIETVQSKTNEEIRRLIVRSARRYPKGSGFNILYTKLKDVSNGEKDVFALGETNINDGQLEKYGTKSRGKSFLNTIFAKGWQYELAVLAKGDMYEGVTNK